MSQSEISLVPYSRIGEAWTLSDDLILDVIGKCDEEGNFDTVFYDGKVVTHFDFLDTMQSPWNIPVFVFLGHKPAGFAWLNGIAGDYAFGHFCFLKALKGRADEAGRMIVDYWMSFKGENGELFQTIIGMVPASNVRAIEFVQRIGFVMLGSIPRMLTVLGEKTSACIFYKTRQ